MAARVKLTPAVFDDLVAREVEDLSSLALGWNDLDDSIAQALADEVDVQTECVDGVHSFGAVQAWRRLGASLVEQGYCPTPVIIDTPQPKSGPVLGPPAPVRLDSVPARGWFQLATEPHGRRYVVDPEQDDPGIWVWAGRGSLNGPYTRFAPETPVIA